MRQVLLAAVSLALVACSIDTEQGEVGIFRAAGAGAGAGGAEAELPDPGPDTPLASFFLTMYLRDFKRYRPEDPTTNPGFDNVASESKVVESTLGLDRKPVYRTPTNTSPTFGKDYFDQWYRDVPGTNYPMAYPLPMTLRSDGFFEYDSQTSGKLEPRVPRRVFFPLDDGDPYATPFGNQGAEHNFGFTGELHATFSAGSGQSLHLRADDDLYVFIDDKLVTDLGGTHIALEADVDLDQLGLLPGTSHSLDLFYAERFGATGALTLRTNLELVAIRP